MHQIDTTEYYTINPSVYYTFMDNQAIMMGCVNEELFGLNEVATEIIKKLEFAPMSIEKLSNYIIKIYAVAEEQCVVDIMHFIKSLLDKQLILRINY